MGLKKWEQALKTESSLGSERPVKGKTIPARKRKLAKILSMANCAGVNFDEVLSQLFSDYLEKKKQ